jgi:hypothetical protein
MPELSNFFIALVGFAIGVSQNATWDAVKALAKRLWTRSQLNLEQCLRQSMVETIDDLIDKLEGDETRELVALKALVIERPEAVIELLNCMEGPDYGDVLSSISTGSYQALTARRFNLQNSADGGQVNYQLIEQVITNTLLRFRLKLIYSISSDEELLRTVIEMAGLSDIKLSIQSLENRLPGKPQFDAGISLMRQDLDSLRKDLISALQSLVMYVESRPIAEQQSFALEYEKAQHKSFVAEVANLLNIMGYMTEAVGLNGIDLCAVTPDAFAINVGIICWNQSRPVEVSDLSAFHAAFQQGPYQLCYLISTTPLDAAGEAYFQQIRSNSFRVLGYDRFVLELISFDKYLKNLIDAWEADPCAELYIPARITDANGEELGDLEHFIQKGYGFGSRPKIAILGDYGTGKTTFCKRYAAILAANYLKERIGQKIPIYVHLGEFELGRDLMQLIHSSLMRKGIALTKPQLHELIRRGLFCFLFDGFDEMSSEIDRRTTRQNLRAIEQVVEMGDCTCVLTCRTHFFLDSVDERHLGSYIPTFLVSWGRAELIRYLGEYFGAKWEEQLQKIQKIHNLEELARTPLLLAMIVHSLSDLKGNNIRAGQLYQAYTERWIEEEDRKSITIIDPEQKRAFMSEVAWQLHVSRRQRLHYKELEEKVKQTFNLAGVHDTDCHAGDVRTRSFLIRDEGGYYYFSHKSFMEYFVAQRLARKILDNKSQGYGNEYINPEIDSFLSDLLNGTRGFEILVGWARSHPRRRVRKNAAMTLARARYSPAIKDLKEALDNETDIGVACLLADSLRKLGRKTDFLHFITHLEAFEPYGREQASGFSHTLFVFEPLNDPEYHEVIPHLIENLNSPNAHVRKFAAIQLGRFRSSAIFESLETAIREESVLRNRRYLVLALGRMQDSRAIPLIEDLLAGETDSVLHNDYIEALRNLTSESQHGEPKDANQGKLQKPN